MSCSRRACWPPTSWLRAGDGSADASVEPVEAAIAAAAAGHGIDAGRLLGERNVVGMRPFDSERKRMSVTVESADGRILFAKGAPEKMIERLVDEADRSDLGSRCERWAEQGMRVLIVAKRELPADDDEDTELTPLGILGIHDAARAGVARSVEEAREAGVRTVMITGDHPGTALAIARETGIVEDDNTSVMTGAELDDALGRGARGAQLGRPRLCARRSAAQGPHRRRAAPRAARWWR